jgi:hypothetical protein
MAGRRPRHLLTRTRQLMRREYDARGRVGGGTALGPTDHVNAYVISEVSDPVEGAWPDDEMLVVQQSAGTERTSSMACMIRGWNRTAFNSTVGSGSVWSWWRVEQRQLGSIGRLEEG